MTSPGLRRRRRLLVTSLGLVASVLFAGSANADPVPVQPPLPFPIPPSPPEFDHGFYLPSADILDPKAPGEIIAARQVNLANFSLLPLNVDAWQLSYRSTNTRGEPVPAVATVIKPRGGTQDGGPRKLVSVQIAEDSLGQYCAPSYSLQLASIPGNLTGSVNPMLEGLLNAQTLLHMGYAVIIPDYQGPNSAYAAGPLHARITLDGIRAAEQFAPLGLPGTDTRVGLMGYSGGAIATGHSAELHASYAPELNIVGVSEGGIPADLEAVLRLANGNVGFGLILAAAIGVSREYPELADFFQKNLNPAGQLLLAAKNPLCVSYQTALMPFLRLEMLYTGPGDPVAQPQVQQVLAKTKIGQSVPTVPMYMYNANPDYLIPIGQVNALVDTYCKDPAANVTYTRDHFSEHISLEPLMAPSALLWLRDRLNGVPVEPGCHIKDVGTIAGAPEFLPGWGDVLGNALAAIVGLPIGAR